MLEGFEWIDGGNIVDSVFIYLCCGVFEDVFVVVVVNMMLIECSDFWIGVFEGGYWLEIMNMDLVIYGGENCGNFGGVIVEEMGWNG